MITWVQRPYFNSLVLLDYKNEFFISYLAKAPDTGNSETALVFGDKNNPIYWILSGDWRLEYEKAFPHGLEACKKVFLENIEFKSFYSN